MDYAYSDDQEFLRDTTRKFLESEVPLTAVRELAEDGAGFDRGWWKRGAELGWTSMLVPEDLGGGSLGGGLIDLVIIAKEFGRLTSPGPLLPTNLVAAAIAQSGTESQREHLLAGLIEGDLVAAWALFEPAGRWRPEDIALEAEPRGDDFVLSGVKTPVEAGAQADHFLVTARTAEGPTQFLVAAETPGLRCTPLESLDLVRRFAELRFDEVVIPGAAMLGELAGAADDIERQLQIALVLQCAESVGAMDRLFETTLEYMFDRFSFGRPLASYQALKHRFADMKMWVEASHATADAAARAVEAREAGAGVLASAATSYIGDHSVQVLQECIQMHGGMGVTFEHDAHLYLRRATQNRVLYGTPSEHRERIASRIELDEGGAR
ncbi:MAG: acyl-CoA dehydrogenase family protein [bacterium]|nr:acyl-CoA dehydrogenase [Deltaproteobacteria bacterium]MCP4908948.1 acyl-CoA dehydrogenase family protein [bacterium]